MEEERAGRLRVSELMQNLVTEYTSQMKTKCSRPFALDDAEFESVHADCWSEVLEAFSDDQSSDVINTQILKQQLNLKYLELKRENDLKPSAASVAGGAVAGTAAGAGVAAGGAVGTVAVTSALTISTAVATGGLVLVGIAAVGIGIGVGVGVKKLVSHIQEKKNKSRDARKSK